MAQGDVFAAGPTSVAAAGFLDIQPGAGVEAVINNIYHEDSVSLQFFDGTNGITFDSVLGAAVYANFMFHVTNARRIRVKNDAAAAKFVGYDGIQTKILVFALVGRLLWTICVGPVG